MGSGLAALYLSYKAVICSLWELVSLGWGGGSLQDQGPKCQSIKNTGNEKIWSPPMKSAVFHLVGMRVRNKP